MPHNLTEKLRRICGAFLVAAALIPAASAQTEGSGLDIGGDLFLTEPSPSVDAGRDVFAIGISTSLSGDVAGDAHAVGFSVEVDAATAGDLYATGGSVSIRGTVGSDLTATGGSVRTHRSSATGGNSRLTGGTVTIEGPVEGALVASGAQITLNAPIKGDAFISGARISFGPEASVAGQLRYATGAPLEIPASVADPARVRFERIDYDSFGPARRDGWDWPHGPEFEIGPIAVLGAAGVTIGSFLLVGAVFLAFAPELVSRMRKRIVARPGETALFGLIGLSLLFGAVPILGMTLVGIPLVPLAILAILIVWFLGYVLGAYSIGMGVARGLGIAGDPSIGIRLLVLASAALVAAVLNFIPILGWLVNLAIVIFGVGAMTFTLFEKVKPGSAAS